MPRLPKPVIDEIKIESDEDIERRKNDFYSMIVLAITRSEKTQTSGHEQK